jgi:hypothetical protein
MKRTLFLALVSSVLAAQAATVRIRDRSASPRTARVLKQGQPIHIPAMEMQVAIGSDASLAEILMVHDPQTGLFLWRYQEHDPDIPGGILERFEKDAAVVAKEDKLVEFQFLGATLWVRESTERYSTMSEGEAALISRIERYGADISHVVLQSYQEINLAQALRADFLLDRSNPDPSRAPKLREASASGSKWRVVLDGPNGDTAIINLGEKYQVEGVEIVR